VIFAGALVAAARGPLGRVLDLSAAFTLAFVCVLYPWHFAWYMIPPLAFAGAAPRTRTNVALLVVVLVFGLLFTFPYLQVRPPVPAP
jgi:hypothetical protein